MAEHGQAEHHDHDVFFFSSRRRHTRLQGDWSSDVCSSDLKSARIISVQQAAGSGRITSPQEKLQFADRKSTRLNSSHLVISYAVFCLKKKKTPPTAAPMTRSSARRDVHPPLQTCLRPRSVT